MHSTQDRESDTSEAIMATVAVRRHSAQAISHAIITATMRVLSELGPGLLESTYRACLQHELHSAGYGSASEVGLSAVYRGSKLDLGYRIDLLAENLVIVENKSVEAISPVHQAQVMLTSSSAGDRWDC